MNAAVSEGGTKEAILEVKDLSVRFDTEEGVVRAVNGFNFAINPGESVGIVGESGCGKSVSMFAALRILADSAEIASGQINFRKEDGTVRDLATLGKQSREMRALRGAEISMIFQEPMTSFSPVHTVGNQVCEAILLHQDIKKHAARERAMELFDLVGLPNPEHVIEQYPFQLSGGMRQRAMIAMALSSNPRVLIADEPTTALDVTIQAQVLKLIRETQEEFNLSLILITHDMGVIAHMVERVYVMYLGREVEVGPTRPVFNDPKHPYTNDLLQSIPTMKGEKKRLVSIKGSVPESNVLPSGCSFHPRCQKIIGDVCRDRVPQPFDVGAEHRVSCFLYTDVEEEVKESAGNL